jgi:flagellar basal body-associated protein FliL
MNREVSDDGAARGRPRWVRVLVLLVIIAVSVVVLFTWVFPWVEELTQDPTLGVQLLRRPR